MHIVKPICIKNCQENESGAGQHAAEERDSGQNRPDLSVFDVVMSNGIGCEYRARVP